jgi:hypothetical protein
MPDKKDTPQDGEQGKDENLDPKQTPGETTQSSDTSPDDKGEQPDWWAEAQKRGFKDQAGVWKAYREAEKGLSEQGEKIKAAERFEQQVAPVLEAVWQDPKLLEQVRSVMQGKQTTQTDSSLAGDAGDKDTEAKAPQTDGEVKGFLRWQVIEKFEQAKGLDKLDDETRKEIRAKIGSKMNQLGLRLDQVQLSRLPTVLEDTFVAVVDKDDNLKKTLKEVPTTPAPQSGAMPSTSSEGGDKNQIELTREQRRVAEKMPGGVEGYKKALEKLLKKSS